MDSDLEPTVPIRVLLKKSTQQLSTTHFDKLCRTCLSLDAEEKGSIFEVTYENVSLQEIFKNCVAVQIEHDDNLPKNMCISCISALVQMYTFKQQCQKSDDILRTVIKEQDHHISSAIENVVKDSTVIENSTVSDNPEFKIEIINNIKTEETQDENIEDDDDLATDSFCTPETLKPPNSCPKKLENNQDTDIAKDGSCKLKSRNTNFTCIICSQTFNKSRELRSHKLRLRHYPQRAPCPVCGKLIMSGYLRFHMQTHKKEEIFSCDVCQKQFSLKCNLQRHTMIHTGERPFTCDICGKGFSRAETLADHKRTHTGEAPYMCSYCGLRFKQYSRYTAHLKRHIMGIDDSHKQDPDPTKRNGNYECDVCYKVFWTKTTLKAHKLTHGGKDFLCNHCGNGFVTIGGLLSHMKVHTGVKPFPCTICDKAFSQAAALKAHMLIHTGEKPFICEVCSKAFTQRPHLQYHMRTHTGERPYACLYCDKTFSMKSTLTVHVRTHTGETPYICDVCDKGFHDSSSMNKHKRGHGQLEEKENY